CCSLFFFSSRRRHTRFSRDWSSDVCSSDLALEFNNVQDDSHVELGVLSGDVDMAVFGVDKFTILKENEQKGNYVVRNYGSTDWRSEERRVGKECRSRGRPYK